MLEHASFKNLRLRLLATDDPLPVGAAREKCLDPIRRSPVKVVFGIFSVSEFGRNRNDALALIIGKRDKNVNRSQADS